MKLFVFSTFTNLSTILVVEIKIDICYKIYNLSRKLQNYLADLIL